MGLFGPPQPFGRMTSTVGGGFSDAGMGPWGQNWQNQQAGQHFGGGMQTVNGKQIATPGAAGSAQATQPMTGTNLYSQFGGGMQNGIATPGQSNSQVSNFSAGQFAPPPTNTGIGSITTSVQPTGIYSPQQTQYAVNQAQANAAQLADPRWQQKQFMTPGRSMDQGTLGAAMPGIAQALFQGQQAAAGIPLQDAFANQQQLQQGQVGQQQEANGLANALAQFNENNIYQQNALLNPLLGLLGQGMF